MINRKAAVGAVAVILCCGGIVAVTLGNKQQPASAEVFNSAGMAGEELIDTISSDVDISELVDRKADFVPLLIKKAFVDGGGCARVIVHNNTDTPIAAYDLEIMHFDENGQPIGENGKYTISGIRLPGRIDYGIDKYVGGSEGGKYIKAVVKKVLYSDGTAWENEDAALELAMGKSSFNIDEFEKSITKNEANVKKAAQNAFLFINDMTMTNADEISGRRDLKLVLTNTSQKTIKSVKVAVAEFDRDNKGVDVSPQIYIGKNIRLAVCNGMELAKGESRSFSSSAFLEKDCYRINAVVTEITFADGNVWKNPYALDWLMWFM